MRTEWRVWSDCRCNECKVRHFGGLHVAGALGDQFRAGMLKNCMCALSNAFKLREAGRRLGFIIGSRQGAEQREL